MPRKKKEEKNEMEVKIEDVHAGLQKQREEKQQNQREHLQQQQFLSHEVVQWLTSLGMQDYSYPLIVQMGYSKLEWIKEHLDESDLINGGIETLAHRKVLLAAAAKIGKGTRGGRGTTKATAPTTTTTTTAAGAGGPTQLLKDDTDLPNLTNRTPPLSVKNAREKAHAAGKRIRLSPRTPGSAAHEEGEVSGPDRLLPPPVVEENSGLVAEEDHAAGALVAVQFLLDRFQDTAQQQVDLFVEEVEKLASRFNDRLDGLTEGLEESLRKELGESIDVDCPNKESRSFSLVSSLPSHRVKIDIDIQQLLSTTSAGVNPQNFELENGIPPDEEDAVLDLLAARNNEEEEDQPGGITLGTQQTETLPSSNLNATAGGRITGKVSFPSLLVSQVLVSSQRPSVSTSSRQVLSRPYTAVGSLPTEQVDHGEREENGGEICPSRRSKRSRSPSEEVKQGQRVECNDRKLVEEHNDEEPLLGLDDVAQTEDRADRDAGRDIGSKKSSQHSTTCDETQTNGELVISQIERTAEIGDTSNVGEFGLGLSQFSQKEEGDDIPLRQPSQPQESVVPKENQEDEEAISNQQEGETEEESLADQEASRSLSESGLNLMVNATSLQLPVVGSLPDIAIDVDGESSILLGDDDDDRNNGGFSQQTDPALSNLLTQAQGGGDDPKPRDPLLGGLPDLSQTLGDLDLAVGGYGDHAGADDGNGHLDDDLDGDAECMITGFTQGGANPTTAGEDHSSFYDAFNNFEDSGGGFMEGAVFSGGASSGGGADNNSGARHASGQSTANHRLSAGSHNKKQLSTPNNGRAVPGKTLQTMAQEAVDASVEERRSRAKKLLESLHRLVTLPAGLKEEEFSQGVEFLVAQVSNHVAESRKRDPAMEGISGGKSFEKLRALCKKYNLKPFPVSGFDHQDLVEQLMSEEAIEEMEAVQVQRISTTRLSGFTDDGSGGGRRSSLFATPATDHRLSAKNIAHSPNSSTTRGLGGQQPGLGQSNDDFLQWGTTSLFSPIRTEVVVEKDKVRQSRSQHQNDMTGTEKVGESSAQRKQQGHTPAPTTAERPVMIGDGPHPLVSTAIAMGKVLKVLWTRAFFEYKVLGPQQEMANSNRELNSRSRSRVAPPKTVIDQTTGQERPITNAEKEMLKQSKKEEERTRVHTAVVQALVADADNLKDRFLAHPQPMIGTVPFEKLALREAASLEQVVPVVQGVSKSIASGAIQKALAGKPHEGGEDLPVASEAKKQAARNYFESRGRGGRSGYSYRH